MTAWVAIVPELALLTYFWTAFLAGQARGRHGIQAPAVVGHPEFERAYRVQMNTLEWIVIFLPGMWLFAAYVNPVIAALIGLVWIAGRIIYGRAYIADPKQRSLGFMIQASASAVAVFGGLIGAVWTVIAGGPGA